MDGMEKIVESTLDEVSAAHSDAITFAIEVNNLVIPEVDFVRIKSEAQNAEEEVSIFQYYQLNFQTSPNSLLNESICALELSNSLSI